MAGVKGVNGKLMYNGNAVPKLKKEVTLEDVLKEIKKVSRRQERIEKDILALQGAVKPQVYVYEDGEMPSWFPPESEDD